MPVTAMVWLTYSSYDRSSENDVVLRLCATAAMAGLCPLPVAMRARYLVADSVLKSQGKGLMVGLLHLNSGQKRHPLHKFQN